ncbi:MAG TPA: hypothetical protein VFF39_02250 [Verrucomicrobiae bacterium]|nr:hypothetical protein [Verrucomicrobiae bacterium]
MSNQIKTPFESIENAQQYIRLLIEAVKEAKRDIDDEISLATLQTSHRRVEALCVVEYNLGKLERSLSASGRTLSDLRSLRRLLHDERAASKGSEHQQASGTVPLTPAASTSKRVRAGKVPMAFNL